MDLKFLLNVRCQDDSITNYFCRSLLPVLKKQVKFGAAKQVKHAVRCIAVVCPQNKDKIYSQIFDVSVKQFSLKNFICLQLLQMCRCTIDHL